MDINLSTYLETIVFAATNKKNADIVNSLQLKLKANCLCCPESGTTREEMIRTNNNR